MKEYGVFTHPHNPEKISMAFLVYWWPGREYSDWESLPAEFKHIVRRCQKSDSRYLAYACVDVNGKRYSGWARCMDVDNPRRSYGRNRALGLLHKNLLEDGYGLHVFDHDEETITPWRNGD